MIYIYILSSIIKIKDIDQQLRQPLRRKRPRVLRVSSRDAHLPAPLDSSKRLPNDRHPTPFRKHPQVGAGARVLSGPRRGPQRTAPLFSSRGCGVCDHGSCCTAVRSQKNSGSVGVWVLDRGVGITGHDQSEISQKSVTPTRNNNEHQEIIYV